MPTAGESPEQLMRVLVGPGLVKESLEGSYANFHGVAHSDLTIENLIRTKLVTDGHTAQLRECVEMDVHAGLTDSGTSTSTTATTLVQTGKNWTINEWAGFTATSLGDTLTITSNTANTLTGTWAPAQPVAGIYTIGGVALSESVEQELIRAGLTGWS